MQLPTRRVTAGQLLHEYDAGGGVVSAELSHFIQSPQHRLRIYKLLNGHPVRQFATLIRLLFRREIQHRAALWEGTAEDRGDDFEGFEGIYDCAFLLYRLGDPADVHLLWEAKWLNMDVGTNLGAEFFVGGGVESVSICSYLRAHFNEPGAARWQVIWAAQRSDAIGQSAIISIEDITGFVKQQQLWVDDARQTFVLPRERRYLPSEAAAVNIRLDRVTTDGRA